MTDPLTRAQHRILYELARGGQLWATSTSSVVDLDEDPNERYLLAIFSGDELAGTQPVQLRTVLALAGRGCEQAEYVLGWEHEEHA